MQKGVNALQADRGTRDMRDQEPLRLESAEREYIRALYTEHYRALRGYAGAMGFRGDAAEDLLQETFLTAIRRVEALRRCRNPRAYLMQILRNVIGYRLRSMKYASELEEKLLRQGGEEAREGRDALEPEVLYRGLISDGELRLLLRFYQDGLTVQELAREQGLTPGACKMRLKRAREHLRSALETDGLV